MKNIFRSLLGVVLLFAMATFASGQTALTSTTLSAAVTSSSANTISVTSATGFAAGNGLYVDREYMTIIAVSGTTISVQRGMVGTRGTTHANAAVIYVGSPKYFINYDRAGTCVRGNEVVLPQINIVNGRIYDCFGSSWQFDGNTSQYKLAVAPGAQPSATSPVAGNANSIAAQAGGAQSATTSGGAAGGANTITGGVGGIGGSSSGTAGAGGADSVIGGAGGAGPVTGGAGGLASVGGGAGGNGSSAGGTGGGLNLYSGAKGTGGTGTDGAINIRQGGAAGTANFAVSTAGAVSIASVGTNQTTTISPSGSGAVSITGGTDPTKIVKIDASGQATALTHTLAFADSSTSKTSTFPNATGTVSQTVDAPCAAASATCTETVTANEKEIRGISGALNAASPSVAAVTFSTGFTSSSTYTCTATPNGSTAAIAAGGVAITYTSATVVTFTAANGASHAISFRCKGN